MHQLSEALRPNNKILIAAIVALGWYDDEVKRGVFDYADFLNLMAYDKSNTDHSPIPRSGLEWLGLSEWYSYYPPESLVGS